MNTGVHSSGLAISELLRADPQEVGAWTRRWDARHIAGQVGLIVLGAGLYGGAMGWWRDPQQALYTAIKFPLIILLVTAGNGLLNSMLAPLLGLNIPFRQSLVSILMSFAIASVILGSFSPLVAFLVWNAPPIGNLAASGSTYSVIMLTHVAVIAFAGLAANVRLWGLLRESGGSRVAANRVLIAWLSINLFLGSQLSWIFRPFIGAPGLELQFFREHPLAGNFYEAVYRSMTHLLNFD